MSENEMKDALRKDVNRAHEFFQASKRIYGNNHKITVEWGGQWHALDSLWNKLYPNEEY